MNETRLAVEEERTQESPRGSTEPLGRRLADWDGLGVITRVDRPTGAWIFIALHDDTLGRPTGGTRMRVYPGPADALHDAQRLAEGMTHKWAAVGVPFGGGKAVIAPPAPLDGDQRRGLLERYGKLLASLGGAFATGEDLGTTPDDMTEIARHTRHVMGGRDEQGSAIDPGPFTARGVFRGIAAAVSHVDGAGGAAAAADGGAPRLDGKTVLIQGVGDVGEPLARLLAAAGTRVLISDLDGRRAAALASELGGETVAPGEALTTPCDVFAPCAVGAVIHRDVIPGLRCRVVAGSANNQLADDADAERLHRRGILYAPDYLINGGGALAFGLMELTPQAPHDELLARVERLGDSLAGVFAEAAERDESPLATTHRRVVDVLAGRRPLPDYAA